MRFNEIANRVLFRLKGRVVKLLPAATPRGNVLISYTTLPFLNPDTRVLDGHSNRWECMEMARQFLARGYAVDIIDFTDKRFVPRKPYDYFLDIGENMERLAPLLGPECVKIFHITTAHFEANNAAEMQRIERIRKRRSAALLPRRLLTALKGPEIADMLTTVAGDWAVRTYAHIGKKINRLPLSTTHVYPFPNKDFEQARRSFIWFGGAGAAHKGLDLVLEAFAGMTEFTLFVCGKVEGEKDFMDAYREELSTKNVRLIGTIDPGSDAFKEICGKAGGIIYPSSAEGMATSVIVAMHAGLVPIVSRESGIEVGNFGTALNENSSIEELRGAIKKMASLEPKALAQRARKTWEYARDHHTRHQFALAFKEFLDNIKRPPDEEEKPLISVVIPVYNEAGRIRTCLEAICQQTYRNLEILVIDDHSTDDTREVVEAVAKEDQRVTYHLSPVRAARKNWRGYDINAGWAARDYGFRIAKGMWLTTQDADDASLLNRIEAQYELAKKYGAALVTVDWQGQTPTRLGKKLDVEKVFADKGELETAVRPDELARFAHESRGLLMRLPLHRLIPFPFKWFPPTRKLFYRRMDLFPGADNCMLFRRKVLEKASFRHRNHRTWGTPAGRGSGRDFVFQVADIYKNSWYFKLPLYLWNVKVDNPAYRGYDTYLL